MMSEAGLPVTRAISAWNKPLQADWKATFKALANGAKNGVLGRWEELPGAGVELLSSIGLKTSAGERAYLLIRRALTAAIHELVGESVPHFRAAPEKVKKLAGSWSKTVEKAKLCIDRRFFERPAKLSIVEDLHTPLEELLVSLGLVASRATRVSRRLGAYFTFHLAREWREHPTVYAPLQEALEGPFAEAVAREQGWVLYNAWLQKQAVAPVFGESFSLGDVYIPLRAYWEVEEAGGRDERATFEAASRRARSEEELLEEGEGTRVAVDLHEEIEGWLLEDSPPVTIRLLSGGPGSGKSTFARMLAARVSLSQTRRVLYLPLHLLDPSKDLTVALGEFVARDRFLTTNPLEPKDGDPRLFLVFDGLDELALQGKVGSEVASDFAAEVIRTVDRLNGQGADIRALITGRPVAVDPQRTQFRRPEQLLFALPYSIPETEHALYTEPGSVEEDQRHRWWRQFGECVGRRYEGLPAELARDDLAEITRQPLLSYLLARSYERGEVDFSRETSLNEIYADLLDEVYERKWGTGEPAVRKLGKAHFRRLLEEIAVAAWHGNGRTASLVEIETRFRRIGHLPLLDRFAEGAEAGIGRLLLAFYFRRAGRREGREPTFELTHKSFGEYLVASRLVGMIAKMHDQVAKREADFEAGWDVRQALSAWAELAGPSALEATLLETFRREVSLHGKPRLRRWQASLSRFLSRALKASLPMDRVGSNLSYRQMSQWARNAEETLLAALNSCARITGEPSRVEWPHETAFGDLIVRTRGQRSGPYSLALQCLGWIDAEGAVLLLADLYGADLTSARLRAARLPLAVLEDASLQGADLREADLEDADLERAVLTRADLREAKLWGADLRGATLWSSDLRGSKLQGANLRRADLSVASLEAADLQQADLREAVLRDACLQRADLRGANLQDADLRGADLRGARLSEEQLGQIGVLPEELAEIRRSAKIA